MKAFYTCEKNAQLLIALMKYHNIKKIVVSPGATNVCFVGSIQQDSFFELYSAVDERSAAYMACGLAAESGEPVALSCTGATASRNYVPGLTEAFYRKLPVLAITSTQNIGKIGNHVPQVIDRSQQMKDLVKLSIQLPTIYTDEEGHYAQVKINNALLELRRNGGNPVHINLETTYNTNFSVQTLPNINPIDRITLHSDFPAIKQGKIGIYIGAHSLFTKEQTRLIDQFCELYNGVVFCDQTSNYRGKYRILPSLVCGQVEYISESRKMDIMLHIGEISGAHMPMLPIEVWRINLDGEVRDTFGKLRYIFEMSEEDFFEYYIQKNQNSKLNTSYFNDWQSECARINDKVSNIPFSNIWIARNTAKLLPNNSSVYFGILNTLRAWNFVETPMGITGYSNTGGFGIEGGLSTILGASLYKKDKLYFCFLGDLSFFYDMNAIGNRHVGNNIRIMVVNNGRGTEFRNYGHNAAKFGEEADPFMAAAGHFGNKSREIIKHYAEDLGFKYICAASKEEYLKNVNEFIDENSVDKPIIFEVFTDSQEESDALELMYNLELPPEAKMKNVIKGVLGEKGVQTVKSILNRN